VAGVRDRLPVLDLRRTPGATGTVPAAGTGRSTAAREATS
jgi:hypothetical protein